MERISKGLFKGIDKISLGEIDEGLEILDRYRSKNPMVNAVVRAELAAFMEDWDTCFEYCSFGLSNPGMLNSLNVFKELSELLALSGLKLRAWEKIHVVAQSTQASYVGMRYHHNVLSRLQTFAKKGDSYTQQDIRRVTTGLLPGPSQPTEGSFKATALELLRELGDSTGLSYLSYLYSTMQGYNLIEEAIDLYEKYGLDGIPYTTYYVAKAYIQKEGNEKAWEFLAKNISLWVPEDPMQVLPVELLLDPSLSTLMNKERGEFVVRLPKGLAAVRLELGLWKRVFELKALKPEQIAREIGITE